LTSSLKGKPVSAQLTVGVVDEMIYALQPEIAPNIGKFFYPLGRNNVRTSSSLSFISYDQALSSEPVAPGAELKMKISLRKTSAISMTA
ncbi:TPA: hypothetical protein OPG90_001050, partial [Shigella flexneri]|nr:hypothetical protein [Shigella flexneri]